MYSEVVILGVIVSIFFTELTALSPGGLVVVGYFVLCFKTPLRIAVTLLIAVITMLALKMLGKELILYGRRRFAAAILISFALMQLIKSLPMIPYSVDAIGYLVPGIIARECDRQGALKTLLSMAAASMILTLLLMARGYPVL